MQRPGKMISEVLKHVGKTPATTNYPFEKAQMPVNFRGRLNFLPHRCKGCMLCTKDCPSGAIHINKLGDKKFEAVIDLDRCIFCAQCVDSCFIKALEMTTDFELASLTRDTLTMTINEGNSPKPPPEPEED
jgi:formate hydrogenlyase subunit 6/NADH:ubiquinone oxidoreductase subunit I